MDDHRRRRISSAARDKRGDAVSTGPVGRALLGAVAGALLRGPAAKIARHAIAAGAGWLAALPGMAGTDGGSLWSLGSALLALGITAAWSAVAKGAPGPAASGMIRRLSEGVMAQAVPLLAGWMAARGYQGGEDDLVAAGEWLGVMALNLGLSLSGRRDAPPPEPPLDHPRGPESDWPYGGGHSLLWLALAASLALAGCSTAGRIAFSEGWTARVCVEIPVSPAK